MAEKKNIAISLIETNKGQIEGVPANPRTIKDKKFKKLVQSIEANPEMLDLRELLVYPHGDKFVIIGGNMRYEACKKLGYKELPCKVIPSETDAGTLCAYVVKDNGGYGEWDFDALANEWDEGLLDVAGIDLPEIKIPSEQAEEDDFDESTPIETRCKAGDIWQLGEHRLMCGDSTDSECVAKLMGGASADMLLTDPPYGMHLNTDFSSIKGSLKSIGRQNKTNGNKYNPVIGDNEDFRNELIDTIFIHFNKCKEMFIFGADYFAELIPEKNKGSWLVWDKRKESQADAIGSEFELIWSKNKHKRRMLRFDWFGFLSSTDAHDARNRVHPTQKPVSMLCEIINQWGGECKHVVDLYGGSGSTLIACEQLNRKCYTMELDPHYCDVILARWEKFTGKTAVRL